MDSLINLSKPTFYVRLDDNRLSVRYVEKRKSVEYPPDVLMDVKKGRVIAIGPEVEKMRHFHGKKAITVNGFKHPRLILDDFEVACKTLRAYIKEARRGYGNVIAPIIIVHPLKNLEGGLSQIEIRTCVDMAQAAGARRTYVWIGRELTDIEASSKKFPLSEGKLITITT